MSHLKNKKYQSSKFDHCAVFHVMVITLKQVIILVLDI